MTTHTLKAWPETFAPIFDGVRNFDIRKDDRHFNLNDVVQLREWEPNTGKYSGRRITARITYVMQGVGTGCIPPLVGLMRGYAILALADIERKEGV